LQRYIVEKFAQLLQNMERSSVLTVSVTLKPE
jgi:hypothetical protein